MEAIKTPLFLILRTPYTTFEKTEEKINRLRVAFNVLQYKKDNGEIDDEVRKYFCFCLLWYQKQFADLGHGV